MIEKARIFSAAVRSIERAAGVRLTKGDEIRTPVLKALGYARFVTGLSVRPRLLAGDFVEKRLIRYFEDEMDHYADLHGQITFHDNPKPPLPLPEVPQDKTTSNLANESRKLVEHPDDVIPNRAA